jgi:hypothetical protein
VRLEGVVTAKNKLSITGTVNGAGGYQGVLVYKALKGNSIDIKGTSNAWDAIHFANIGSVTSATTLLIDGDSSAVGKGILFSGTGVFTADSYSVKAKTAVNNGIWFGGTTTFNSTSTNTASLIDVTRTTAGGETIYNAGTLTINSGAGKATLQTSTDNVGGGIRINGGSTVNTIGDVTIGSKNSSNAYTMHQGTINAQGNLKLSGQVNSATRVNSDPGVNAGVWLQDSDGVVAKIFGTNGANITIDGTNTSRDAGVNLSVNNSANIISTTGTTSSGAVGNISITGTSTSGTGIANAAATISNDSGNTGNKGNVTLVGKSNGGDHWGITSTGQITAAGLVKMTGTAVGIRAGVSVGAKVEGGSVDIYGSSTKGVGVEIAAIVKSTDTPATSPGVTLTGFGGNTGGGINNQGVWVRTTGSVDSASKVSIVGTNAVAVNTSTLMGTLIQGTVKAAGDINLEGYSTSASSPNHGLVINNTVTSTGGNITATASAANGQKVALLISGGGALIASGTNQNITLKANTMDFSSATATSAINAGTVNITTKDADKAINIGVGDFSGPSVVQRLSLDQAELNKITAAKTVIGDSLNTGGIALDNVAVTTNASTGNITLLTAGNIAINRALTVGGTGATNNLTLNGAGASSTIIQNAAGIIKAAGLELLGTNATHTLNNAGNDIKKLAGDTKTVSLTNNANFAIDTVNTVGLTTSGNTTLNSTAAVTQTAAIKSAGLELLGAGGSYTLNNSGNTVQKLAGNTGTVSLTNQGNLTVGVVNATTGLTAANDIKLTTTTATGTALTINNDIKSDNGNVNLIAITSDTNSAPNAAVWSKAHVQGRDVTMSAKAQGLSGRTLGYRGTTTGKFTASNDLTLIGSTQNEGSGLYMYGGALAAGNALTIEGTSAKGQGVGFDKAPASSNVNIASGNGITIKGTASNSTSTAPQAAINLKDVDLTNSAGAVTLEALKGDITTGGTGILTQNGNGDVKLTTVDHGNIFVPKIINKGTGNVVIAAGSDLFAANGGGGQVKTFTGNTITQKASGQTYIYTGNANDTGSLSAVGGFANGLFLSTIGTDTVNAASNTEYKTSGTQNTIAGGAKTQVMFREKVALTGAFNNATLTYGDSTNSAAVKAALQATNPASGSSNIISTTSNAGIFKILNADFFADMASGKPSVDTALSLVTNKSTSGNLKANSAGYNVDIAGTKYTLSTTAKLVVNQKSLTALYAANDKVFDSNTNATVTGSLQNAITGDLVNPTNTNATFDTSAVGTNKLVRITGISLAGFDAANYKIDLVANPTFTATATAAITPIAPKPPAPVVPTGTTSSGVKIPLSAANPFQLASAEDLGGEDFCKNTSIDPLNENSTANSNSSCTCEESKLAQDAQICFEKNTQKVSLQ